MASLTDTRISFEFNSQLQNEAFLACRYLRSEICILFNDNGLKFELMAEKSQSMKLVLD